MKTHSFEPLRLAARLMSALSVFLLPFTGSAQEAGGVWQIPAEHNSFVTKAPPLATPTAQPLPSAVRDTVNAPRRGQGGFNRQRQQFGTNAFSSVTREGMIFSLDTATVISSYFYVKEPATFTLSLNVTGKGELSVKGLGKAYKIKIDAGTNTKTVKVGKFAAKEAGYVRLNFQAIDKAKDGLMKISDLEVAGLAMQPYYIKKEFSSHFGRRGPSVHLRWNTPRREQVEWFYNEITVPAEGEVVGSYYCAQGFTGGYFGFQYNSPRERRVLFSIWSPFDTQNPREIPEEYQVKLVKQGEGATIGQFGNEGAGAQSYLIFPWKAGNTYRFLLHAMPAADDYTEFSAYFYAPEAGEWRLVATWKRPKTQIYIQGVYSFVENFSPEQGWQTRRGFFHNGWYRTPEGEWKPVQNTTFTNDETGRSGIRVDYLGGVEANRFFLQMGGFFGSGQDAERNLSVPSVGTPPDVDLSKLPQGITPHLPE